jgi:hypothetical protein
MTPMIKVKISIEFMVPPVMQVVLVSEELYVLFGNFMQGIWIWVIQPPIKTILTDTLRE